MAAFFAEYFKKQYTPTWLLIVLSMLLAYWFIPLDAPYAHAPSIALW